MISETIYAFLCLHSRLHEDSTPFPLRREKREEWHQRISSETGLPIERIRLLLGTILGDENWSGWGHEERRKELQLTVDEAERLVLALAPTMEQLEKSLKLFQKMTTFTNESGRQVLNFIMRKNDEKTRN